MDDLLADFDSDPDGAIRRLRAFGTTHTDQWEAYASEFLGKLSDDDMQRLVKDVAACNFAPLHPQFIRACITVQMGLENQRRLNAAENKLRELRDDPPAS